MKMDAKCRPPGPAIFVGRYLSVAMDGHRRSPYTAFKLTPFGGRFYTSTSNPDGWPVRKRRGHTMLVDDPGGHMRSYKDKYTGHWQQEIISPEVLLVIEIGD